MCAHESALLLVGFLLLSLSDGYRVSASRLLVRMSLTDRISNAVKHKFPEESVGRVLDCFNRFSVGTELDHMMGDGKDDHNRQRANCYVDGLTTAPFHDVSNGKFDWALRLEEKSAIVAEELKTFLKKDSKGREKEEGKWLGPRFTGEHYGPEWKTLGLQDRGVWDGDNVESFPETVKLLSTCNVPSCEAFFARQGPQSGILPHSDLNNFIITAHLAVDVPEGECWIKVGDETHHWKNGKVCVFDTSIYHSTRNEAAVDRFVLLIRFWHPDLSAAEIKAFTFIFDFLDHSNLGDEALNAFEAEHVFGIIPEKRTVDSSYTDQIYVNSVNSVDGDNLGVPISRQMRREQEKRNAKAMKSSGVGSTPGKKNRVKEQIGNKPATNGFHRGA